jgi:hypothetical protein
MRRRRAGLRRHQDDEVRGELTIKRAKRAPSVITGPAQLRREPVISRGKLCLPKRDGRVIAFEERRSSNAFARP